MTEEEKIKAQKMLNLLDPLLRELAEDDDPIPLAMELITSLATTLFRGDQQLAQEFLLDSAQILVSTVPIKVEGVKVNFMGPGGVA